MAPYVETLLENICLSSQLPVADTYNAELYTSMWSFDTVKEQSQHYPPLPPSLPPFWDTHSE